MKDYLCFKIDKKKNSPFHLNDHFYRLILAVWCTEYHFRCKIFARSAKICFFQLKKLGKFDFQIIFNWFIFWVDETSIYTNFYFVFAFNIRNNKILSITLVTIHRTKRSERIFSSLNLFFLGNFINFETLPDHIMKYLIWINLFLIKISFQFFVTI